MSNGTGRLSGKVAIVTGAGSSGPGVGTGKAISILFAREQAKVCLVDIEPQRAEETLETICSGGGDAFVAAGDVASGDDCKRIVSEAIERYGKLDVLVNNVGIVDRPAAAVGALEEDEWDRVLRVNLKSVMLMTKAALPALADAGRGAIVNMSSIAAIESTGRTPAYAAAKAAMLRLTADTAVAYGRAGVRANAIAPGHIYTPLVAAMTDTQRANRRAIAPLGVEGTAWDVAWAALFLASDESRFITGVCLPVDAGVTQIAPLAAMGFLGDSQWAEGPR